MTIISRLLSVSVLSGVGGQGVDGSLGAEQQNRGCSPPLCSAGVPRGVTQTLGAGRGRALEGSCTLSSAFAARTRWKLLWLAVQ